MWAIFHTTHLEGYPTVVAGRACHVILFLQAHTFKRKHGHMSIRPAKCDIISRQTSRLLLGSASW